MAAQPLFRDPCVCGCTIEEHKDPSPSRLGGCTNCFDCNVYFPANPPEGDDADA